MRHVESDHRLLSVPVRELSKISYFLTSFTGHRCMRFPGEEEQLRPHAVRGISNLMFTRWLVLACHLMLDLDLFTLQDVQCRRV